LFLKAAALTRN